MCRDDPGLVSVPCDAGSEVSAAGVTVGSGVGVDVGVTVSPGVGDGVTVMAAGLGGPAVSAPQTFENIRSRQDLLPKLFF